MSLDDGTEYSPGEQWLLRADRGAFQLEKLFNITSGFVIMAPAGDKLVRINLVTRVPDQSIFAEIVNRVQRDAELDDAEIGCEMGGTRRNEVAENISDLDGKLVQFFEREIG